MTAENWWQARREPMPTAIKYSAMAGAFTIAWSYLNGNVETAAAVSEGLAVVFLALAVAEWAIPIAEAAGGRIGGWWQSRQHEVEP